MNFKDQDLADKFQAEYGENGYRFMQFVLDQNMQLDIIKTAMQAAQENKIDVAVQMLNMFSDVHANMTALFAGAAKLTEENAVKIFNSANEEYVKTKEKAEPDEVKTND